MIDTLRRFGSAAVILIAAALAAGSGAAAEPARAARGTIAALAFDASNGALLEATTTGLYKSADEGRTWSPLALPASGRGHIAAVAAAAKGKGVLYVGGPGIGVLRSADAGRKWTARNKGLPSTEVVALSTHAEQPDTVYAYVAKRGIFRSEDGGNHWKLMDAGPRDAIQRLVHSNMPGSMQTGWFFAATAKGVSRSMDCFCGWRDAGALARPIRAVTYDPKGPQRIYAASDDGLYLSVNGGEQWERINAPAPDITALVATPSGVLYAAAASGVLFRSTDGARNWAPVDA